jgi:GT2 family glycosyltransferase
VKHFAYDLVGYRSERKVSPCGSAKGLYALAGPAQWLSGCSMGFRKEVFDIFEFNEDLETFSPYALGEDIEFSHRVFRRYRKPLRIAAKGKVVHRPSPKPRFAATETALAARLYNRCHLMKAASANRPLRARAGFFWFFLRTVFAASFSLGVMPSFRSAVKVFSAFFYKSRERRV